MVIIIDKSNAKNASKILKEKLTGDRKKSNLAKYFGKLKRNLDGLAVQLEGRIEQE